MAKKALQPDAVTVRYDLHDLPTAQHKAGLAGLLLQIESMRERIEHGALPSETPQVQVSSQGPTFAEFRFTAESVQSLFDDLYAAEKKRIWVDKKWQDAEPLETRQTLDAKTGKSKTQFQYEVVEPAGPFLARYTDGGKEIWHKLWGDMLWAVPRGKPTTRGPYKSRANGMPTKEGAEAWTDLLRHQEAARTGNTDPVEIAGAVLLGAQAVNAEKISFEDLATRALLLHFWQLTTSIYTPERIVFNDKMSKWTRDFWGYLLVIPSVADLHVFAERYRRHLALLDPELWRYRPKQATVGLPHEGAFAFMSAVIDLTGASLRAGRVSSCISGVDFFYWVDRDAKGNKRRDPKIVAHDHLAPDRRLLQASEGIRKQYDNPDFRFYRMRAALRRQPWFAAFDEPLAERESEVFVCPAEPTAVERDTVIAFAMDCASRFRQLESRLAMLRENSMDKNTSQESVDDAVYRIIGRYVHHRTLSRLQLPHDKSAVDQWKPTDPKTQKCKETVAYRRERHRVCLKLFLDLRSRHGDDFVRRFTEEISSVDQFLPRLAFQKVAAALMLTFAEEGEQRKRTRDDVKTLTLLALSAHSRSLPANSLETTQSFNSAQEESAP